MSCSAFHSVSCHVHGLPTARRMLIALLKEACDEDRDTQASFAQPAAVLNTLTPACFHDTLYKHLQVGEVAQDLVIVPLDAQRVLVALDGLIVVLVRPVEQPDQATRSTISPSRTTRRASVRTYPPPFHLRRDSAGSAWPGKDPCSCGCGPWGWCASVSPAHNTSDPGTAQGSAPVHVPGDVALQIVLDAAARQLVGLLLARWILAVQDQALHGQRLAMLRILFQHRVRRLPETAE